MTPVPAAEELSLEVAQHDFRIDAIRDSIRDLSVKIDKVAGAVQDVGKDTSHIKERLAIVETKMAATAQVRAWCAGILASAAAAALLYALGLK